MNQRLFEKRHKAGWQKFEHWLTAYTISKKSQRPSLPEDFDIPEQYRKLCQHLAIARDRNYSSQLLDRLHYMVILGHNILYHSQTNALQKLKNYATYGFPRDMRSNIKWFLYAMFFFMLPLIIAYITVRYAPDVIYMLIPTEQIDTFDANYTHGLPRNADEDWYMFGVYIYNNVGIAFRACAGGLLAGLGTINTLITNGFTLGGFAARADSIDSGYRFFSFISSHAPFELTGILISGSVGLKLGWHLLVPKNQKRSQILKAVARSSSGMIAGSMVMLSIAAAIEAFWSSRYYPLSIKIIPSLVIIPLLILYFTYGGKRNANR